MRGWKSERIENNLVFPRICLVGGVEKWESEKFFYLVEKKSEKIENVTR